ncbi:flagellar hook assembly protein FlgD [Halodesulfovibrio marinisediminis]|uniref:Basal-body rod modification protein FlgD n=1 Tax=Halodesulfovibrio marinisediminis DSM 17456 TaxID=1121457 RepID=A0A1N6DRZ7_9BACT|nr:flagellar hook capping FlgD N-terminal domain-containing protein [Halodesulfovibrio marinisediminis]SIN73575.1 flagellar basal-body rod modification protein FlgD [Halodesulfovibrio marinisediminis DSM 17456]
MQVSTTQYLNSTYSRDLSAKEPKSSLGKDDFMKLLTAQMSNQNPLKPSDDTQMLAQLAQFTSLEKLTELNTTTKQSNAVLGAINVTNAVGYIGTSVVAGGSNIYRGPSMCSDVYYTVPEGVETIKAHVYDASKRIVDTVVLSGTGKGEHIFGWDGTNSQGRLPEGQYTVGFEARDKNGKLIKVGSKVAGEVTGVTSKDGRTVLELEGGRKINLVDITRVERPVYPSDKKKDS